MTKIIALGPVDFDGTNVSLFGLVVNSFDPNQKLGPTGFGSEGFIAPNHAFGYRIDFENEAEATAPAQRVVVTDQLDANLDWDTLDFTEVGFGDHFISIPTGSRQFQTTVDVTQNGKNFQVEIGLFFDSQDGMITAVFQSIDPGTELPPDALTGFLPPEDGTGRGQGHFSYTIRPKADLTTGTEIRNIANIIFDVNEPITTNQIDPHDPALGTDPALEALVTLDVGTPTSQVAALPEKSKPAFAVEWSGQDDTGGSGVGSYDIYVSQDGGAFELFLGKTTETSVEFIGEAGRTYSFFSVARDNVGNVEAPPAVADASTLVVQPLAQPVDSDAADNEVAEGATFGTEVGLTAFADADESTTASYILTDDAGGRFAIDESSGQVTVADGTLINFDDDTSHTITVEASDTFGDITTESFTIKVLNELPTQPIDNDVAPNEVFANAPGQTPVGITAFATDPNGPPVTYRLGNDAGGRFVIDPVTGEVRVASADVLQGGNAHTITVEADDGAGGMSTTQFTIRVLRPPVEIPEEFAVGGEVGGGPRVQVYPAPEKAAVHMLKFSMAIPARRSAASWPMIPIFVVVSTSARYLRFAAVWCKPNCRSSQHLSLERVASWHSLTLDQLVGVQIPVPQFFSNELSMK